MRQTMFRRNAVHGGRSVAGELYFELPKDQRKIFNPATAHLTVLLQGAAYSCSSELSHHKTRGVQTRRGLWIVPVLLRGRRSPRSKWERLQYDLTWHGLRQADLVPQVIEASIRRHGRG
jgi:hypothetical protein